MAAAQQGRQTRPNWPPAGVMLTQTVTKRLISRVFSTLPLLHHVPSRWSVSRREWYVASYLAQFRGLTSSLFSWLSVIFLLGSSKELCRHHPELAYPQGYQSPLPGFHRKDGEWNPFARGTRVEKKKSFIIGYRVLSM